MTTEQQYRKQKAALTRAERSGDPLKVLEVTRQAFDLWNSHGNYWPDGWPRWNVAEGDALNQLMREHSQR